MITVRREFMACDYYSFSGKCNVNSAKLDIVPGNWNSSVNIIANGNEM